MSVTGNKEVLKVKRHQCKVPVIREEKNPDFKQYKLLLDVRYIFYIITAALCNP